MAMIRTAARAVSRVAVPTPLRATTRRMMSSDGTHEEIVQTADMWFKISMLGTAATIVPFGMYMVYVESTHEEHHHEGPAYDHMQMRAKAFPWGKCDLLDSKCKKALAASA